MYVLGTTSQNNLIGCDPRLDSVVRLAIQLTEQDFTVFEGARTAAQEAEDYARGVSHTLDSYHIPDVNGVFHAVDLVPWIAGRLRWADAPLVLIGKAMHRAASQLDVPVTWGGVFDRELRALDVTNLEQEIDDYVQRFRSRNGRKPLVDRPHFQVPRDV